MLFYIKYIVDMQCFSEENDKRIINKSNVLMVAILCCSVTVSVRCLIGACWVSESLSDLHFPVSVQPSWALGRNQETEVFKCNPFAHAFCEQKIILFPSLLDTSHQWREQAYGWWTEGNPVLIHSKNKVSSRPWVIDMGVNIYDSQISNVMTQSKMCST